MTDLEKLFNLESKASDRHHPACNYWTAGPAATCKHCAIIRKHEADMYNSENADDVELNNLEAMYTAIDDNFWRDFAEKHGFDYDRILSNVKVTVSLIHATSGLWIFLIFWVLFRN
jgi:hypothetical protein